MCGTDGVHAVSTAYQVYVQRCIPFSLVYITCCISQNPQNQRYQELLLNFPDGLEVYPSWREGHGSLVEQSNQTGLHTNTLPLHHEQL